MTAHRCPECWNGKPMPCAGGCREWDECCGKSLDAPCARCGGSGWLKARMGQAEKDMREVSARLIGKEPWPRLVRQTLRDEADRIVEDAYRG